MIKKVDHFVITTQNIDECLSFYRKLGFKVVNRTNSVELLAENFKINVHFLGHELFPHAQNIKIGSADLCFEINGSLSEIKKDLENLEILSELGEVTRYGFKGEMSSIYLRDPDGNLIELCSYER